MQPRTTHFQLLCYFCLSCIYYCLILICIKLNKLVPSKTFKCNTHFIPHLIKFSII